MFLSSTIIRELALILAKVTFMLKHMLPHNHIINNDVISLYVLT